MALVLLLGVAEPARGQVFLASNPHPPFSIGPLFVIATITPDLGPVTMRVSWGLTHAPNALPADLRQNLHLLWPAEVAEATAPGFVRPEVRRYVEERGFEVVEQGRLLLRTRGRDKIGTPQEGDPVGEAASFVTFYKRGTNPVQSGLATFIEIPWTSAPVDPASLLSLRVRVKDLIAPKPAAWFEQLFWGRRHILTLGTGPSGSVTLFSMYLAERDRVIPIARDFSLMIANFTDADHLRIEEISPPAATRQPSRQRAGVENVTLPLHGAEGGAAQVLKVHFTYYSGRIAWRPILISLLFLVLGNLMGAFMFTQQVGRFFRRHFHLGRGNGGPRQRGVVVPPETIERIVPGVTTRAEVVSLCGSPDEEHERFTSAARRTLIYRGTKLLPHRRFSVGWISTVSRWEEEHHEVEIVLDVDVVSDIQTRVRRTRLP